MTRAERIEVAARALVDAMSAHEMPEAIWQAEMDLRGALSVPPPIRVDEYRCASWSLTKGMGLFCSLPAGHDGPCVWAREGDG